MNEGFRDHPRRRGLSFASIAFLVILLVFPALAGARVAQTFDARWIVGYFIVISAATCLLYRNDKQRAQSGEWRTPESTLHLAELLGGWPAAFLAQRALRHKISKTSYQVTFWLIVSLHQLASFDFLQGWQFARRLLQ